MLLKLLFLFKSYIFMSIFYLSSIILLIAGIPFLISETLTYSYMKMWCKFIILLVRIFGVKSEIINVDKIPNGSAIVCCNHQSYYEIILLFASLPKAVFIMKESIMKVPIYSWYCKKMGMISVDRSAFNQNWMKEAKDQLDKNKQVVIFPEGTRVPIGRNISYKKGAFKLASMLNMKIYPVSTNAGEAWIGPGFLNKSSCVYLKFHEKVEANPEDLRQSIESTK